MLLVWFLRSLYFILNACLCLQIEDVPVEFPFSKCPFIEDDYTTCIVELLDVQREGADAVLLP